MNNGKIEISLKDLILFILVLALFLYCFLEFRTYKMELGLAQRHTQITQSTQNIQILDQNFQDHERRIKQLEGLNRPPTDTFPRLDVDKK